MSPAAQQLDLFYEPPRLTAALGIDPDGPVCTDDQIDETIKLGDWRTGLRIELAQHTGKWMWGTSLTTPTGGCGYRVGPKWGNFADTKGDAFMHACAELRKNAPQYQGGEKVLQLLDRLQSGRMQ